MRDRARVGADLSWGMQNVSMYTRTQKKVEKKEVLRTMPTSRAAATRCRRAMFSVKKYLKGGAIACK